MLNFPKKTLDYIKKHLMKQKQEVDRSLEEVDKDDPAKTPDLAESSEPGTDSYIADTHTKNLVLKDQLTKMSKSIKATLSKIQNGTYGKCENCGKQIEIGRLLAMPTAEYCVSCSQKKVSKS